MKTLAPSLAFAALLFCGAGAAQDANGSLRSYDVTFSAPVALDPEAKTTPKKK